MKTMTTSTASLLVSFLDVCNRALAKNRESFPYKQLFGIYEKLFSDRDVGVTIYAKDPEDEIGRVTIRYVHGRYEPVTGAGKETAFGLKLKRSYLEKVVANPDEYIEHPERLDWDWLKSRIGLEDNGSPVKVHDIMTDGVRPVPSDWTLQQASAMMRDLGVGALPVADGRTLIGMVTDRDITVRATSEGADPNATTVRQVMTPRIAGCQEQVGVDRAAEIMRSQQIRRLVVLDESEHPVGVVSLGDIAARSNNKSLAGAVLAAVSIPASSQAR